MITNRSERDGGRGRIIGRLHSRNWTNTDSFEFYGVRPRNTRWSWSGRSDDGQTVAVTLWQDRFREQGRIYGNFETDEREEWRSRPGFTELIENLQYARDSLDGVVRVILAKAKDPNASPRSIERSWPQPGLRMRVVALDVQEGTFTLERIEATAGAVN